MPRLLSASTESDCRIEYPEMSSPPAAEDPDPRRVAAAKGVPRSTMASPALPAHAIQASMPACICSGVALAIWSRADAEDRYKTMNLAISCPFRSAQARAPVASVPPLEILRYL